MNTELKKMLDRMTTVLSETGELMAYARIFAMPWESREQLKLLLKGRIDELDELSRTRKEAALVEEARK